MANTIDDEYVVCKHCGRRYKAITGTHLRARHGYTDEHPVREYMERFALTSSWSGELRTRIVELRIEYWDRHKLWTRAKVLAEIRLRYQAGQSLKSKQIPNNLKMAAAHRFGSWAVALQMAGLRYDAITSRRQWDREKVIAEIRKLEADQVPLNMSWVKHRYSDLYCAAIKLFPNSWGKALQAAGFDPFEHKKRRGRWNRKQADAWVRKRIDKGLSLLARDVPRDLRYFVVDALKTNWTAYVESFGIPYPGTKHRRDWSQETVVEEIRRWAAAGHRTNHSSVFREYQMLTLKARQYFGSWDAARTAAGVPIDRGPAPELPAAAFPATTPASAATHSQVPNLKVSAAIPPGPTSDLGASRIAENGARQSTGKTRDAAQRASSHQLAIGHASRRVGPEGGSTVSRDPILAFLARGGLDEITAGEDLSAPATRRESD